MEGRDKTVTGLLAIFLGTYGAHFFYIGNKRKGWCYLLLSLFVVVCAPIFAIVALVDGVKILSMSDAEFAKYLVRKGSHPATPSYDREAERARLLKEYTALSACGAITEEEFEKIRLSIVDRV